MDGDELAQISKRNRRNQGNDTSSEEEVEEDDSSADADSTADADGSADADSSSSSGGTVIAGNIDWSWATLPVMSQGSCGSCWAFTGNTLLEATEYIYQNVPDNEK